MAFEVEPKKLNGIASNMRGIQHSLNSLNNGIGRCNKKLSQCVSSSASPTISRALNTVYSRIAQNADQIAIMGNHLDTIASMYERTENNITGKGLTAEEIAKAKSYNADGTVKTSVWGRGVQTTKGVTSRIISDAKTVYGKIKESYDSHGTVYYAVQYGKIVVKAIAAAAKIAAAITTIAATGGIGVVPAIFALISGMNDVWNCVADVINLCNGNYDQIGETNIFRSSLEYAGKQMGGTVGEKIGTYIYYGIDLIASAFALNTALDNLKNLSVISKADIMKEGKEIGNAVKAVSMSRIVKSSVQDIKYTEKLAEYAFPQLSNLIKDGGILYKVVNSTKKMIEKEDQFVHGGEKTMKFETYDKVNDAYGNVKDAVDAISFFGDMHVAL